MEFLIIKNGKKSDNLKKVILKIILMFLALILIFVASISTVVVSQSKNVTHSNSNKEGLLQFEKVIDESENVLQTIKSENEEKFINETFENIERIVKKYDFTLVVDKTRTSFSKISSNTKINNFSKKMKIVDSNSYFENEYKEFVIEKSEFFLNNVFYNKSSFSDIYKIANSCGFSYEQQKNEYDSFISNIDMQDNIDLNLSKFSFINSNLKSDRLVQISYYNDKLYEAATSASIFASIAAALTAGYGAAAGWFGLTIGSAIAATIQATVYAAQSIMFGSAGGSMKNSDNYNDVKNLYSFYLTGNAVSGAYNIGHLPYSVCCGIFEAIKLARQSRIASLVAKAAGASTSGAAPAGYGLVILCDVILNIANLVISNPFQIN